MRPAESPTLPDDLRQVKTMLSARELTLLYRLARDTYAGCGEIVDGGAFLGGSTLALALGLRDNPRVTDKAFRIHSYDYFVADHFVPQFISGVAEGASTRPYYDSVIAPVASHVAVHEGDITTFPWRRDTSIEILFIDVAKSWETNDFLLHQFFPQLTAGSYVIQQDYHWPHTPWISITMELLKESFTHLESMPWATSFYRCNRAIDRDVLPASLRDLGAPLLRRLAEQAQVFERGGREWTAQQCNIVSLCLSLGEIDEAAHVMDDTLRTAPTWVDYFHKPSQHSRSRLTVMSSRICVVAPEFIGPFPNGGVGTACYWEATTLGAAGHDVTVLYTGPVERQTPEHWERYFASAAPFAYTDLSEWMSHHPSLVVNQRDPMCPESHVADQVLAYLRQERFDLVLFQEFLGHGARAIQAHEAGWALTGARTATTLHSCRQWIFEGMQRLPTNAADVAVDFLEKESARTADRVLAPSGHMAHWAREHWHLTQSIDIVPYCYDATLAQPRELVEHAGPFRHFVFFGRLETRKGLQLFCRALASSPSLARTLERVTFLGKPSSVEGLPSEEFIRRTLSTVPGLAWAIKGDLGSLEALDWLSAQHGVLVVAPSLVDNLPYSLIELHCRRIPFVSTHIGGIPEIVGDANHHLLAAATVDGVRGVLERVSREGRLPVDYRSGYDIPTANANHLQVVGELLDAPPRRPAARAKSLTIVVTGSKGIIDIEPVRSRFVEADPVAGAARWLDFESWRSRPASVVPGSSTDGPVLFVDEHVHPDDRLLDAYLAALSSPGVKAVSSYYRESDSEADESMVAPLGTALESGWWQNNFGGPCVALSAHAISAIAETIGAGGFAYWPAYAALACRGLRQTVIPSALFTVTSPAWRAWRHDAVEAVIREYHTHAADRIDLGWLLKSAASGIGTGERPGESLGKQFYRTLTSAPDHVVSAAAFEQPSSDPILHEILLLRDRLTTVIQRWNGSDPRVFVYGAGQHARLMLQICPEMGPLVAGFIDRRPITRFLGRPCVSPEAFDASMADAVVYSSREFEHEMHARLQDVHVEHVLLYHPAPALSEETTSTRLQRRFGHPAPDVSPLHAMYHPPSWATGYVSRGDAEFLFEMIAAQGPRTVVELGVASGASSAAILCALDQLPEITGGRVLYSCDVRPTCYFDESYATGQACTEMYPEARTRWRTEFDVDARRLARALPRSSVDLTFIDANHAHPWPLLDLLHVTAVAKPRSWVVLHDVDLPIHHPEYQVYGPRWLFQAWPFNKVKGVGRWTSIAAVQLPDDLADVIPVAEQLLEQPWEHAPTMWHIDLPSALASIQTSLARRLTPADGGVASGELN